MVRKSILMAIAATAALGFAALTPTTASAWGGGGGGHGGHAMRGGGHFGHFGHFRPHWHHYVRWHRPIWYRPVVYSYGVRTVNPGPCTCLSKEYTQEGAVLFKDNCTNEMAMNPPAEAPQQTGQLEQQPQTAYVPQYPPQATTR